MINGIYKNDGPPADGDATKTKFVHIEGNTNPPAIPEFLVLTSQVQAVTHLEATFTPTNYDGDKSGS